MKDVLREVYLSSMFGVVVFVEVVIKVGAVYKQNLACYWYK